jgi:hypothetical protein
MGKRSRKNKRNTLRGWWKPIPYIALPIGLLLVFFRLETHRLHNEYRAVHLIGEIQSIEKEIALLKDMNREKNRIERMEQEAPRLQLGEPNPEQIRILSNDSIDAAMKEMRQYEQSIPDVVPITRSARIIFEENHALASNDKARK